MSQLELSLRISSVAGRIVEGLAAPVAAAMHHYRRAAHRRQLSAISDRQLRDAGIDLSAAGRGKAVAVSAASLCRLQSLS